MPRFLKKYWIHRIEKYFYAISLIWAQFRPLNAKAKRTREILRALTTAHPKVNLASKGKG